MKKINLIFVVSLSGLLWTNIAKAVCPLCVVAVGAGLGFSEMIGIDDVVASIWIGALLLSVTLWTLIEMKKHNWRFKFDTIIVSLAYYLLTFVPLYYSGIVGHPYNRIFGIDKIIFGTVIGTAVFLLSHWLHLYLKNKNNGKSFFNYQKVAIPVALLLFVSLVFHLLLTYKII